MSLLTKLFNFIYSSYFVFLLLSTSIIIFLSINKRNTEKNKDIIILKIFAFIYLIFSFSSFFVNQFITFL